MAWDSMTLPVFLFAFAVGSGEPGRADGMMGASIETLKEVYIECERRAASQKSPAADVARCSEVYEALKQRAFGDDWRLLREWFQKLEAAEPHV